MTKTAAISSADTKAVEKPKRGRKGLQCRNLSNEQRASLLQSLLKHRADASAKPNNNNNNNKNATNQPNSKSRNKLRKGALLEASRAFGVSTKTCKRIWERFLETADASGSGGDVSHRKGRSGRPKKISKQELVTKITNLPPETRSSVRGLARALGMPHTTIHRRLKSGELQIESLLCKKPTGTAATTNTNPKDSTSAANATTENTNEALGNQKKTHKTTNSSNTKTKPSIGNKKVPV